MRSRGDARNARALTQTLGHMSRMKKMRVGNAWLAAGCAAFVGAAALAFASFFGDVCANEIIREAISPDGKKKVVVFQRNCGATTGFSTQASVLSVGRSLPDDAGNIFSADTNHGVAPIGPGGGPELAVSWVGLKEIVLEHDAQARVFTSEPRIGDVRVRYISR
jgi:hypothetical protein